MGDVTPIFGLYQPANGETGWGDEVNNNATVLEERITSEHANVKDFGALGDGATDDTDAIQAAVDSGAARVYFPDGVYFLADGSSISLGNSQQAFLGSSKTQTSLGTIISCKNAYAFMTPITDVYNVTIEKIAFRLRSGATSGGGIRLRPGGHGGWVIQDVTLEAAGDGGSTDPGFWFAGFVGSYLDSFRIANVGGHGIYMDSHDAVCNQWEVTRGSLNVCSLADRNHAGLYLAGGGGGGLIHMNDFESIRGKGIWVDGGSGIGYWIKNNWFENNWSTSIHIDSAVQPIIESNKFEEPANPPEAGLRHILFESVSFGVIMHNNFFGPNDAGGSDNVTIEIDAASGNNTIGLNRGAGFGEGNGTSGNAKIIDAAVTTTYLPGGSNGVWRMGGHYGDGSSSYTPRMVARVNTNMYTYTLDPQSSVFAAANSDFTGFVRVTPDGLMEFTTPTGPTNSGAYQNTKSFIPFIDTGNSDALRVQRRGTGGGIEVAYLVTDKGTDGLRLDTTSAGSTPGTCVKKLPIYNKGGTLLGYIPIYDAIS